MDIGTLIGQPEAWLSLLTLTALEIILGIDNIVFITILAGKKDPKAYGCTKHADCAMSQWRDGRCCPQQCRWKMYAYRASFAPQLRAHIKTSCKSQALKCPWPKCSPPVYFPVARCRAGRCVGARPGAPAASGKGGGARLPGNPPAITGNAQQRRGCKTAADCVVSCVSNGRCQGYGCRPCRSVYNRAFLAQIKASQAKYCRRGSFSRRYYRCARGRFDYQPTCNSGLCSKKRIPRRP